MEGTAGRGMQGGDWGARDERWGLWGKERGEGPVGKGMHGEDWGGKGCKERGVGRGLCGKG